MHGPQPGTFSLSHIMQTSGMIESYQIARGHALPSTFFHATDCAYFTHVGCWVC